MEPTSHRIKFQKTLLPFTSAYLAGDQVSLTEDVSFRLENLGPGETSHWEAKENTLRICSVSQGTVVVTLPDAEMEKFRVGPNGMWKVKPGSPLRMLNPFHSGVTIHVTSITSEPGEGWV
jgi:hypothetical protein